jgi:spore coat protein CotH
MNGLLSAVATVIVMGVCATNHAQAPGDAFPRNGMPMQPGQTNRGAFGFGGPGFGGGFGGPGGPGMGTTELLNQFDKDHNGRLDSDERRAALTFMNQKGSSNRGPGGGFGGRNRTRATVTGPKLSPAQVQSYAGVPLYDPETVRTFFLEFEDANWEKQLTAFHRTDVDVPARLTVDGRTLPDVGVHFHGMSSFMMVGEGQKHSMVLSLDFVHPDQQLEGYRKLTLLNSHEDPSFLRTVLAFQIARDYLPAPRANLARVVINGECWGVYVNQQYFNKDFLKSWYGTTKGSRWKVQGSPGARGGLEYIGDDMAAYKRIYTIKSADFPDPWQDLIKLCKVLNNTPPDNLARALAPMLDIDGALKFLAWENVLANADGYWTRSSDYEIFEDKSGRFHIIPYDSNEAFSMGGGPGGPGGPGGRPGGPGGPGGRGFGPGMMLAPQFFSAADTDEDGQLTRQEFAGLADAWFDKLSTNRAETVNADQFGAKFPELLPLPQGMPGGGPPAGVGTGGMPGGMPGAAPMGAFPGTPPGGQRRGGGFDPSRFMASGLFTALDADKDGSLTRAELKAAFDKWCSEWGDKKSGSLDEDRLRNGLNTAIVMPRPDFGGGPAGPGPRGPGGPGGMFGGGPELDPLVATNDVTKPLRSKLLAVPELRERYLLLVRDMAEKWLDWKTLGPIVARYHALLEEDVKADVRKLDSTEEFSRSVPSGDGTESGTLKTFADKRRAYLLNHPEIKKLSGK